MSPALFDLILGSLLQTVAMVAAAGAVAIAAGIPLAVLTVVTDAGGLSPRPELHRILSLVLGLTRSAPFIVLLIALLPISRLLFGASVGPAATILPLGIGAIPYLARFAETSLRNVDPGLVDAARAMGANPSQIIRNVMLAEALPGILAGFTTTLVTLVGAAVVAGAVGAGGLGELAIRYGYQTFDGYVMFAVALTLIALVWALQAGGERLARWFDRSH
jgi:D-methionine transport system permease protein